eukprot:365459-Chlamydomonas_euryale.AAC.7
MGAGGGVIVGVHAWVACTFQLRIVGQPRHRLLFSVSLLSWAYLRPSKPRARTEDKLQGANLAPGGKLWRFKVVVGGPGALPLDTARGLLGPAPRNFQRGCGSRKIKSNSQKRHHWLEAAAAPAVTKNGGICQIIRLEPSVEKRGSSLKEHACCSSVQAEQ